MKPSLLLLLLLATTLLAVVMVSDIGRRCRRRVATALLLVCLGVSVTHRVDVLCHHATVEMRRG